MSSSPLVSVVMPAYNAEAFVADAVASVRRQSLDDWELIVVDDGSADQTAQVARQAAGDDSRIRVISLEQNQGISAASNAGFDLAQGAFIARMDSDDTILPDRLAVQVSAFSVNERLVAVGSHVRVFGDVQDAIAYCAIGDGKIKARMLDGQNTISGGTMMVRGAFVRERLIRFNDHLRSAEDLDYLTSIIAAGGQLENIDQVLTEHRSHGGNFTKNQREVGWPALQLARKRLLALWYPQLDPADLDRIVATFGSLFAPYLDALLATIRAVDRLVTARPNDFGQDTSIVHSIIFDWLINMAATYKDNNLLNASHCQAIRCFVSPAVSAALDRLEL